VSKEVQIAIYKTSLRLTLSLDDISSISKAQKSEKLAGIYYRINDIEKHLYYSMLCNYREVSLKIAILPLIFAYI